jgi:hypothetical protein
LLLGLLLAWRGALPAAPTVREDAARLEARLSNGTELVFSKSPCVLRDVRIPGGISLLDVRDERHVIPWVSQVRRAGAYKRFPAPGEARYRDWRAEGDALVVRRSLVDADGGVTDLEATFRPFRQGIFGQEFVGLTRQWRLRARGFELVQLQEYNTFRAFKAGGISFITLRLSDWRRGRKAAVIPNNLADGSGFDLLEAERAFIVRYAQPCDYLFPPYCRSAGDHGGEVVDHHTQWELGRRTEATLPPIVCAAGRKGISYENAWLRCRAWLLRRYAEHYKLRQDAPEAMVDCNFGAAGASGLGPGKAMDLAQRTLSRAIHIGGVHQTLWRTKAGALALTQPEAGKSGDQTLREICREAHRRGLRVFLWHNASGFYSGLHAKHPDWILYGQDGKPQSSYGAPVLGLHSDWARYTVRWFADRSRKALGDEGIDGIFVDSAANDGAQRIDYRSGEVMLPHWIAWLSALGHNGIQVVSEMPHAFGLGNFLHDNPKHPWLCFMAFNNVLGQGQGPDPEMDEETGRTGNEHAPMYFCRVRGCYYDQRDIAILRRENANFNRIMDTFGRRPDYIEQSREGDVKWLYLPVAAGAPGALPKSGYALWRRDDRLELHSD